MNMLSIDDEGRQPRNGSGDVERGEHVGTSQSDRRSLTLRDKDDCGGTLGQSAQSFFDVFAGARVSELPQ